MSGAQYAVVARFDLKPDGVEAFDALAQWRIAQAAANEPGLVGYAVHRIDGEPLARVFYEIYRDEAAFREHRATAQTAEFGRRHVPFVQGPPRIEFMNVLLSANGLAPRP
ncbi:putative quinol monooxygenase [Streptomyces sp. NPDC046685]|uniref:putative quinol monooxygenase n=1 Tax=Streptomyces sp. NPDC046685 TaxID=3157202 RepID=UPI0033FDA047